MYWFAQLLNQIIEKITGATTGYGEAAEEFAGHVENIKEFLSSFTSCFGCFTDYLSMFGVSSSVVNFVGVCLGIWVILIVANVVKGFVGG